MTNSKSLFSLVVLVAAGLAIAQQTQTLLSATLTGAGKGKAVWKTRVKPGEVRGELQVEGENLAAGATYTVNVGPLTGLTGVADAFGKFSVKRRMTTSPLPNIPAGTVVTVLDSKGIQVLTGTLR